MWTRVRAWLLVLSLLTGSTTPLAAAEKTSANRLYSSGVYLTPLQQLQIEMDQEDLPTALMALSPAPSIVANVPAPAADTSKKAVPSSKTTIKPIKPSRSTTKALPRLDIEQPGIIPASNTTSSPEANTTPVVQVQSLQPLRQPDISTDNNASAPLNARSFKWGKVEMPAGITSTVEKVKKQLLPVSYTPLEAVAIFPVIKQGREKAFSDLSIIFSRELALKLEEIIPKTKVYHPVYSVEALQARGLGYLYNEMMAYYLQAGRPEPTSTDFLLKQLSLQDGKQISRIIFVEADLDVTHIDEQSNWFERANQLLTDSTPKQMKYFLDSRLQVFDAEAPNIPMVWGKGWRRSIKLNQFLNVTPSVFSDSDSQQTFSRLSREMSKELLWVAPRSVYMMPHYDLSVQGQLATKQSGSSQPDPVSIQNPVSDENKQAIQRILQRQNTVSP